MSRERIVRAFAGSFVLVSLALGWWLHPGFFLFTAFVGANLLQSSFTGFCPLESILRRLEIGDESAVSSGRGVHSASA